MCAGIAERAENTPPVWIAAAPACSDQRAFRYRARSRFSIARIARATHMQRDESRNAFTIAYDHLRQLESDEIQRLLKKFRISNFEFRISGKSVGKHDHRVVGAHIAIDRDAIETLADGHI